MAPRQTQEWNRSASKPSAAPKAVNSSCKSVVRGNSRPGSARGNREVPSTQPRKRNSGATSARQRDKSAAQEELCKELPTSAERPSRTAAIAAIAARTVQRWWRSQRKRMQVEQAPCTVGAEFSAVPAAVLAAMTVPGPEEEVPAPETSEPLSQGPPWCPAQLEPVPATKPAESAWLGAAWPPPEVEALPKHAIAESRTAGQQVTDSCGELPNNSRFFVQQRRTYCPGVYTEAEEDSVQCPPPAQLSPGSAGSTADRVAQMRSRIKSLQELRAADSGAANAATAAVSAAPRPLARPPLRQPSPPPPPQPEARLASIMSFLDDVEESSRADISSLTSSARSSRAPAQGLDSCHEPSERPRPLPSALVQDAAALQSRASLLEVEVRDKKQIIDSLKRALSQAKEHEKQTVQETVKEWEDKLQKQKAHYEAGIERHLRLVDRLLNDKTELTKRCELFAEELKAVERKFQMKIEELDEQASKDLAKNKQNWIATERLKREAWEKEKVKEIKEMTIKGLQPEVERILAEKKQEKLKMEERQREALEEQHRELTALAQQQVRDVREQKLREQEEALDREREAHRRKLRDEFDRFNRELQEERTKCAADLLAERRQREEMLRQGVEGSEARLREALEAQRAKSEAALKEARASAAEAESQHRLELSNLEERLRKEAEQAQRDLTDQARLDFERREAALRAELAAERDRQLEVLMERLSREHVEEQRALKEDAAAKVQEARAQAGDEAGRLARKLEEAKGEVAAAASQKSLLEQNVQSLKDCQRADAARLEDLQKRCSDLEVKCSELQIASEKASEQHKDELWKLSEMREKELDDMREDLGTAHARVAEEQKKLEEQRQESRRREEQVIGELEARVKKTLQTKDETIAEMKTRCVALENKVREFEYLLERQREELLGGIMQDSRR